MKILFQGDSITDASRTDRSEGQEWHLGEGYALMVAGQLSADEPGQHTFLNRGVSGNRIVDVYARIKKDGWNLQPDVFSLLIGVNDVWHEMDGENGVDAERFERVYRMLLEDTLTRFPEMRFILMGAYLLHGAALDWCYDEAYNEVCRRAEIARKQAEEYHAAFIPLQEMFDEACRVQPAAYWVPDGVHPSCAGNQLIARAWIDAFHKLEKK